MECQMEQVLYRDQRTTKTRYFDVSKPHQQNPFSSYQNGASLTIENSYLPPDHRKMSSFSHFGGTLSIRGGAPHSSLDNYCHNQYFSNFKRLLHWTGVCGCENVSFSGISIGRRRRTTSWLKKFQNLVLLSTYLSLLTLPSSQALPATMSSEKQSLINSCMQNNEPNGEVSEQVKTDSVQTVMNELRSALDTARELKENILLKSRELGSDPESTLQTVNFTWLPKVPKVSNNESFKQHLNSLEWRTLLDIFKYVEIISVPMAKLITDYQKIPDLKNSFSKMAGLISNVLCELRYSIDYRNLIITKNDQMDLVLEELEKVSIEQTDIVMRDWIVLRELIHILEYSYEVCDFLLKKSK